MRSKDGADPLFSYDAMGWYAGRYMPAGDRSAPLASPVFATLAGLPPLLIQVGSHEVLLDDAVRLAANAGRDDADVTLQVAPRRHACLPAPLRSTGRGRRGPRRGRAVLQAAPRLAIDCVPHASRLRVPPVAVESPRQPPQEQEPQMRVGISGTHGTGKTTLAGALCAHLPGHVTADEPYYLLEEEGHEFGFPPSPEDYRALLARSLRSLSSPPLLPGVVFDRTPLDYLAYMAATGADPSDEAGAAALRPAFASLDLLVITLITPETEQVLPAAEMPGLRSQMNDALLELVYDDPLNAWEDIPVLELTGPLDRRLDTVLAALGQPRG